MSALTLEVDPFTDADHWRWVLKDVKGAFLADHTVALDPSAAEYEALVDLRGYLRRHAAPDRRLYDESKLMDDVGRWLGRELLGPIADRLADLSPAVVRVLVPGPAQRLLFLPLEAAWGGRQALARQGVTFVYDIHANGKVAEEDERAVRERLRVLALFSLPVDQPALALRRERHALKQLLRRLSGTHRLAIELRVLQYGVTREALQAIVDEGWDVLHFSGHGLPANLVLERPDATADVVPVDALVELLRPSRDRLKLITLSACLSAAPVEDTLSQLGLRSANQTQASDDPLEAREEAPPSVAQALVRELDCAVLAMRYPVIDDFAIDLSAELYERLLGKGHTLAQSLQQGLPHALGDHPRPEAPPMSVATPALFGRRALELTLQAPPRPSSFVVGETGFAYFPPEPERFVGRVRELSEARRALSPEADRRGVLFHGMAGAGKTSCALELAYGYESGRFEAFVWHKAPDEGSDIVGSLQRLALDLETQLPGFKMAHLVDRADALRAWLPRLTQLLEDNSVLLVLDNLESLLTPDGAWRDERWHWVIEALLAHDGLSRTVLTSRIRPIGLDERVVLVKPIHALSLDESVLLARELPHLGGFLNGGERERALVVRALGAAQGHPKLLELAEGQATTADSLASYLGRDEAAADQPALGQRYLREGASSLSDQDFVLKLRDWTRLVADALPSDTRLLFHVLCCFEEDDRLSLVLDANWADIWHRLGHEGDPPDRESTLDRLAEVALVEVQPAAKGARYRVHPGVADAGRADGGPALQDAVDRELAAYWLGVYQFAGEQEVRGGGGLLLQAARSAVPYLLRLQSWSTASRLLSRVIDRDSSPTTVSWLLPLLRLITRNTRGTNSELEDLSVLAKALAAGAQTADAERLMREVADRAAEQPEIESAVVGDLMNLLAFTGRTREALALVDRKQDATQRAGLGPWTQLGNEARRLQLLSLVGEYAAVLAAADELRARMAELPETGDQEERVVPWSVREFILDIGRSAAQNLEQFERSLALCAEMAASKKVRGAPDHEQARTRFNSYGPLLRLGRIAEARALLEWCGQLFEREGDLPALAKVMSALADLEDELGHFSRAVAYEQTALRYRYANLEPGSQMSHHNLSNYLERVGGERRVAIAHRLASAVICWQIEDGTTGTTIAALANDFRACAPDTPPVPENFEELCQIVQLVEGVRLRELFERLPRRAADGDQALQIVLQLVAEFGPERGGQASSVDERTPASSVGGDGSPIAPLRSASPSP